jgi:hypothetical protein
MFRWRSALCSVGFVSATTLIAVPSALGAVEDPVIRVDLSDGIADVWSISDTESDRYQPAGSVPTADVTKAVVAHKKASVVVRMSFVDLKPVNRQAVVAFITTPRRLLFGIATTAPGRRAGRHQLVDYERGNVRCPGMTHRFDYDADRVSMRIPRNCLNRPRWVKVTVMNSLYKRIDGVFTEFSDNPHNATSSPGTTPRLRLAQ